MPTITEITEAVQDGIMKVVETNQRLAIEAVTAAASTVDGVLPKASALPFESLVSSKDVLAMSFGFAERLLESQKSFITELVAIAAPAAPRPAKRAAAA